MGNVATLSVKITASTSDFEKSLGKLEGQWKRTGAKLQSIGSSLTTSVTLPLAGIGIAAIKASSDFEAAMTKTVTLAGETKASMEGLRGSVLDLSKETGVGPTELANALVAIESNGVKGHMALDILTASAKGSAIGMGEAADIGRALTAVMNSYGDSGLTAAQAADQFHQIVLLGGADAATLAPELGRVIPMAHSLGVSFAEAGAFIATYTQLGIPAAEATTALSGVLHAILSPSTEARAALAGLGMSADDLRNQVSEQGLGATLTSLIGKLHGNYDATAALFGNVRALAGVMGTAGVQAAMYKSNLDKILTTSGSLNAAFAVWEGTTAATWSKFTAGAQAALLVIGDQLAPAFSKMLKAAMPLVDLVVKLATGFSQLPQPVQTMVIGFLGVAAAAGPMAYAIGSILKAGGSLIALFKMIPGATSLVSGAWTLLANPIGAVVLAVSGLIIGIKELTGSWTTAFSIVLPPVGLLMRAWQDVQTQFAASRGTFEDVWTIIKDLGTIIANSFVTVISDAKAIWASFADTVSPWVVAAKGVFVDLGVAIRDGIGGAIGWAASNFSFLQGPIAWLQGKIEWLLSHIPKIPSLHDIAGMTGVFAGRGPDVQGDAPVAQMNAPIGPALELNAAMSLLESQVDADVAAFNRFGHAGANNLKKVTGAAKELLESTRILANDLSAGAFPGVYTGVTMGGGGNMGGLMPQLGMLASGSRIQDIANQAGMAGLPDVQGQNISQQVAEYAAQQMADSAKETVDGMRKAFQYFTGSLSGGMAALLGGVMNILEKGAAKGGFLQKLLGGKAGQMIGTGLDIGMSAFGGGFGMGESFGKGKGALGGAATGALSGFMVGGPIGAAIGGIAGLLGGIFGGGKKKREEQAKMGQTRSDLVEQFGGMDNLRKQAELAGVSIDLLFSTTKPKVFQAELEKVGDAIKVMQERIKGTIGEIDKAMAGGDLISGDLWKKILPDAGADDVKAKLIEVFQAGVSRATEGFNKIATNFELLKRPIAEVGVLAQAAFAGMLTAGASLPEAMDAMSPGLNSLRDQGKKTGEQPTGDLAALFTWQGVIEDNKGLFELLAGVNDMIVGLGNSGLLTQATFSSLGNTVSQAFGQLQSKGVAATTALQLMQPQLQNLWQLEKDRGLTLDSNTQKLVDQAVTQGIVGPQMQSVEQKMLDVMLLIAKALGADIPAALLGLPEVAGIAAGGVEAQMTPKFDSIEGRAKGLFNGIPKNIPIEFDMRLRGEMPPGTSSTVIGSGLASGGYRTRIPGLASGGIVSRPTTILAGEAGPEAIVPLDEYMQGSGVNVNITVNGTADRDFARVLAREISLGGDVKTAWRGALR